MSGRDQKGRFSAGNKLGRGRPPGSRNRLGEVFVDALCRHFEKNGQAAIREVFKEDPGTYLRIIARVIPAEIDVKDAAHERIDNMSDAELQAEIERLRERTEADAARRGRKS